MEDDVLMTSLRYQFEPIVAMITDIQEQEKQRMACSANFSMALQTEILSTETLDLFQTNYYSHVTLFMFRMNF